MVRRVIDDGDDFIFNAVTQYRTWQQAFAQVDAFDFVTLHNGYVFS